MALPDDPTIVGQWLTFADAIVDFTSPCPIQDVSGMLQIVIL